MQVLGFVPASSVQPWAAREAPFLLSCRKDGRRAAVALTALNAALRESGRAMVLRLIRSGNKHATASVALAIPYESDPLLLLVIPQTFQDEMRDVIGPPVSAFPPEMRPTAAERRATSALISAMMPAEADGGQPAGAGVPKRKGDDVRYLERGPASVLLDMVPDPKRARALRLAHACALRGLGIATSEAVWQEDPVTRSMREPDWLLDYPRGQDKNGQGQADKAAENYNLAFGS